MSVYESHSIFQESLQQLQKAIKGFVVMSLELDKVYTCFLNNQVGVVLFMRCSDQRRVLLRGCLYWRDDSFEMWFCEGARF